MRGQPLDPEKCCETVFHEPGMRFPRPHQCRKNFVVVRDGKPYCHTHDPVEVKRRRDERQSKFEAEQAANAARHARHSDLLAKGEKYDALFLRASLLEQALLNFLSRCPEPEVGTLFEEAVIEARKLMGLP